MTAHEEIARERFLDLRAAGVAPKDAVKQAIDDATAFVLGYVSWQQEERQASRGFYLLERACPRCFGRSPKDRMTCERCGGTGRIHLPKGKEPT